jgi:hypothetical protein
LRATHVGDPHAGRRYQFAGFHVLDLIDSRLVPRVEALGMRTLVTDTIMTDDASRARLAAEVLAALGAGKARRPRLVSSPPQDHWGATRHRQQPLAAAIGRPQLGRA